MSKIVPFPGNTRPTALSRPAPVIGTRRHLQLDRCDHDLGDGDAA